MTKLYKIWVLGGVMLSLASMAAADKPGAASDEIDQLQQDIEASKGREQDVKQENAELRMRMQELESRILELRQGLIQEEESPPAKDPAESEEKLAR